MTDTGGNDLETTSAESRSPFTLERRTTWSLLTWGVLVWMAVTGVIRLSGQALLSPSSPLVVAGFFASVVPLMALVTYPIYRRFGILHAKRGSAAALMSLPGMFLDVLLVVFAGFCSRRWSKGPS